MSKMPGPAATTTSPGTGAPERSVPPVRQGTPSPARRGRRLIGTAALAAGALLTAAAIVAVGLVAGRPHHVRPAVPLRATVFGLRPGQCINSPPNGSVRVRVVPCARPHDAEIFGTFRVAARRWPGTATLGRWAQQGCQTRLGGYLNPQLDTSGMAESFAYPNQAAWSAGARSVICEIRGSHGKLTGSVRTFGR